MSTVPPNAKAERIVREYDRRACEVPSDFYAWSRRANLLFHTQTVRACVQLLHRAGLFPLNGRHILDVGCGTGTWLLEFIQWAANPAALYGIDLDANRIERARQRLPPRSELRVGDAAALPWSDASFDIVAQFTVFTSILDMQFKRAVAAEMLRVLKPGGAVLWFDFRVNNPNNRNVQGIGRREIRSLFPGCTIQLESALLAPPIGRLVAPFSWVGAELLHTIPILRSHYAGLIIKPGGPPRT